MFLLLGYGISNQSVERFLKIKKIPFVIYDDNIEEFKINISFLDIKVIVKSGGISNNHKIIKYGIKNKIKIVTDLELVSYFFNNSNCITVTGTNGKTTTVSLLGSIINSYKNINICGNIGIPIFDCLNGLPLLIEASSFMLEYVEKFHSQYNVILNLSIAHQDVHINFKNYCLSKLKLLRFCNERSFIIYNYDDLLLRRLIENFEGIKIPFSKNQKVNGCYLYNNSIYYKNKKIIPLRSIKLIGNHNIYNIMASIVTAINYRIPIKVIEKAIKSFNGIEHRIEYVTNIKKKKVYNDSKSTNYHALYNAITCFINKKILLICGGKIKTDNIYILNNVVSSVKVCLVYGENKFLIEKYMKDKKIETYLFSSLEDVVENMYKYINKVNVVLFSPGSSSQDQFSNFEERGRIFKSLML